MTDLGKVSKLAFIGVAALWLFWLAAVVGIGWVTLHFIAKWW